MKAVPEDFTFVSLIVFPRDILVCRFRSIISDLISTCLRIFPVFASGQLIPLIIGFSIAIYIFRYKYDTRFGASP